MGRRLGYPTANIAVDPSLDVPSGVYAAIVTLGNDDETLRYGAMANLGVRPTFTDGEQDEQSTQRLLELHLFDFEGDLYGRELTAELVEFIRPEQKFENPDALRSQIEKDEKTAKNILKCI